MNQNNNFDNNNEYNGFVFLNSFAETFWALEPDAAYQYVHGLLSWALYRRKIAEDELYPSVWIALINAYPTIEASQTRHRNAKLIGAKGGRPRKEDQPNDQSD